MACDDGEYGDGCAPPSTATKLCAAWWSSCTAALLQYERTRKV